MRRAAGQAVGLIETQSVASGLRAADVALKRAQVTLVELRLAKGIGGKAWFTVVGELADVESALEGAVASVPAGLLVASELIQQPHDELSHGAG